MSEIFAAILKKLNDLTSRVAELERTVANLADKGAAGESLANAIFPGEFVWVKRGDVLTKVDRSSAEAFGVKFKDPIKDAVALNADGTPVTPKCLELIDQVAELDGEVRRIVKALS